MHGPRWASGVCLSRPSDRASHAFRSSGRCVHEDMTLLSARLDGYCFDWCCEVRSCTHKFIGVWRPAPTSRRHASLPSQRCVPSQPARGIASVGRRAQTRRGALACDAAPLPTGVGTAMGRDVSRLRRRMGASRPLPNPAEQVNAFLSECRPCLGRLTFPSQAGGVGLDGGEGTYVRLVRFAQAERQILATGSTPLMRASARGHEDRELEFACRLVGSA